MRFKSLMALAVLAAASLAPAGDASAFGRNSPDLRYRPYRPNPALEQLLLVLLRSARLLSLLQLRRVGSADHPPLQGAAAAILCGLGRAEPPLLPRGVAPPALSRSSPRRLVIGEASSASHGGLDDVLIAFGPVHSAGRFFFDVPAPSVHAESQCSFRTCSLVF